MKHDNNNEAGNELGRLVLVNEAKPDGLTAEGAPMDPPGPTEGHGEEAMPGDEWLQDATTGEWLRPATIGESARYRAGEALSVERAVLVNRPQRLPWWEYGAGRLAPVVWWAVAVYLVFRFAPEVVRAVADALVGAIHSFTALAPLPAAGVAGGYLLVVSLVAEGLGFSPWRSRR